MTINHQFCCRKLSLERGFITTPLSDTFVFSEKPLRRRASCTSFSLELNSRLLQTVTSNCINSNLSLLNVHLQKPTFSFKFHPSLRKSKRWKVDESELYCCTCFCGQNNSYGAQHFLHFIKRVQC